MKDFNNKKAFITGGSQGIGLGTAKLLAQREGHLPLIGPAGELLNRMACISVDRFREFGRGGVLAFFMYFAYYLTFAKNAQRMQKQLAERIA